LNKGSDKRGRQVKAAWSCAYTLVADIMRETACAPAFATV